jgi:hypothetical protein
MRNLRRQKASGAGQGGRSVLGGAALPLVDRVTCGPAGRNSCLAGEGMGVGPRATAAGTNTQSANLETPVAGGFTALHCITAWHSTASPLGLEQV